MQGFYFEPQLTIGMHKLHRADQFVSNQTILKKTIFEPTTFISRSVGMKIGYQFRFKNILATPFCGIQLNKSDAVNAEKNGGIIYNSNELGVNMNALNTNVGLKIGRFF
jgi:uncharacterized protein (DUF1919 family)